MKFCLEEEARTGVKKVLASGNEGSFMINATCTPVNVSYPQDFLWLNEAREKLEAMVIRFCEVYELFRPRM